MRANFLLVFPHAPDIPVLIPVPADKHMMRPGVPVFQPFAPDIQMIFPVHSLAGAPDDVEADAGEHATDSDE